MGQKYNYKFLLVNWKLPVFSYRVIRLLNTHCPFFCTNRTNRTETTHLRQSPIGLTTTSLPKKSKEKNYIENFFSHLK